MALTIQSIFNVTKSKFKLKLIAGKNGLDKNVSWIYYTEDSSTIDFLRGGEFAITLGVNFERQKDNLDEAETLYDFLKSFIYKFVEKNASGLIINVGKYIFDIPQKIIDLCDELNFPLFTMPWEIHTIDVMQEVGNMIAVDRQNTLTIESFFYNGIFHQEKFDSNQIKNTTFSDAKEIAIVILEIPMERFNDDVEQIKCYMNFSFNQKLSIQKKNYSSFVYDKKVIYILKEKFLSTAKEIAKIAANDKFFYGMRVSISDSCDDLEKLPNIYNHAVYAMQLCDSTNQICEYESLGMYKILAEVKDTKVLEKMYDEILGDLNDFEEDKLADYLKTLQLFLQCGGNIQKVSELNNNHRNTIIYRIKKIEEYLGVDLQDGNERCRIQMAFYIKTFLERNKSGY